MITQDLGIATAYGYAKSKGYTGTEAEFAELMASYASTAQTAIEAADRAVEANTAAQSAKTDAQASKTEAQTAAQTATTKASEASQSASTATTKASEASQSASTASAAATSASTSAQTATTAATTATAKASEAGESATTATTAKTDAESARDAAVQSASEAAASAESIDPDEFDRKIYAAFATDTASGSIASFADGADSIPMKDVLIHIEPVQAGSGDPSPDNVRPITGWTGAKVTRTGKNLLSVNTIEDVSWAYDLITIPTAEHNISKIINSLDVGTYTISYTATVTSVDTQKYTSTTAKAGMGSMTIIASNGDRFSNSRVEINLEQALNHYSITNNLTINVTANNKGKFTHCYIYGLGRASATEGAPNGALGLGEYSNLQLELDSTATDYEPYSGTTYPITFPTEAGTVYGGTLDVTKGELVVDRAQIASYNGEALPSTWISDRDVYASGTMPTIGAQVVYKLASPITYQLTPQEITSLLGTNNLWADTGDSEVEYRADTKLYITKKITEAVSALS